MSRLKLLWQVLGRGRWSYLVAFVAVMLATLLQYMVTIVLQFALDHVIKGEAVDKFKVIFDPVANYLANYSLPQALLWVGGWMLSLAVAQGVFDFVRARSASKAAETLAANLRVKLYDHIQRMPFLEMGHNNTGDLIQRASSDVETVRNFMEQQSIEIFRILFMIFSVIPLMLVYDPMMTLLAVVLLPLIIGGSFYYFHRMKNMHRQVAESEAEMSSVLQETLTGARVVRAFSRQDYEIGRFDRFNRGFRDASIRMMVVAGSYWAISAFFCMLQIGLVLVGGIMLAKSHELSVGTFMVFVTYETTLVWAIRGLGRVMGEAGRAYVSLGRMQEVLDQPLEDEGAPVGQKPELKGELTFRQVDFAYPEGKPVLQGLDFTVKSGETVGIVGPTGSGKSTLVNLIPRLFDPVSGQILLDGVCLTELDRQWLRENVGIVLQEPFLFSRTVGENIRLGAADAELHEIERAARTAAIHQSILDFEKGYDTLVGERGVTLSGGQKQRLAIARALIKEPPILIFDDSLSAVDAETDRQVQAALQERKGQATTFIISHRLSSVMDADWIILLEEGRITGKGTHEQLLAEGGLYFKLWQIQTRMEKEVSHGEA